MFRYAIAESCAQKSLDRWKNSEFNLAILSSIFINTMMLRDSALVKVHARLAEFDSVALLGPRQVGKTTLPRALSAIRWAMLRATWIERVLLIESDWMIQRRTLKRMPSA